MRLPTDQPLFLSAGVPFTSAHLAATLQKVGIASGDTVMVHSELIRLGRIPAELLHRREDLFDTVIDVILEVLGPSGTLIMPTLTTGCLSTGRFDARNTPSETGVLTEHFRKRPGVVRTAHPTHSMAVLGAESGQFMTPPAHPFGEGSSFDVLRRLNGKLLFLGADFHWCTFIHHIETMGQVSYRRPESVRIRCVVPLSGKPEEQDVEAYRFRRPDRFWPDFERFRRRLVERGILKETAIGKGYVAAAPAQVLFEEGLAMLGTDSHAFVNVLSWPRYMAIRIKRLARRINDHLPPALRPYR